MIALHEVHKRYGGSTVVDALSFEVAPGELLVLLGGSGSGKTTTLKMINRLIEPTSGRIEIDGTDTRQLEGHVLRRRIGYVFQGIGLFPHLTVRENIAVTPRLLGWSPDRIEARSIELLDAIAIERDLGSRYPRQLSGGQRQRVGVARALAAEPRVVLFDEPFGALDPATRDQLQELVVTVRARTGFTGVFVTHDVPEALRLGDRIAVMHDGRLIQIGSPSEVVASTDPRVRALFEAPRRHAQELAELLRV